MWGDGAKTQKKIFAGERIEPSALSVERGKAVYTKNCEQCHGLDGRGDITSGKRLKDDLEVRIWPRNLTRPDTWRWVNTDEDLFNLVSTGMRGTPMPQHTKSVRPKDRWHVVNYVKTLEERSTSAGSDPFVVRSVYLQGELPKGASDPVWGQQPKHLLRLAPNTAKTIAGRSLLTDTASIQVVHNNAELTILIQLDDRTFSVPGSELERHYALAGIRGTRDAIAIDLRLPDWSGQGSVSHWAASSVRPVREERARVSKSFSDPVDVTGDPLPPGFAISATWDKGAWRFIVRRPLVTETGETFKPGLYPLQLLNKDGLNGDDEVYYNRSGWWWLDLRDQG